MNNKRKIEIFSAGCATCKETIEMVKKVGVRITKSKSTICTSTTLQPVQSSTEFAVFRPSWLTVSSQVAVQDADPMRPCSAKLCAKRTRRSAGSL